MKVLVVGGGGREHAFVWKLSQSSKVDKIYCAPGNAGIAQLAECVAIAADDVDALLNFAKSNEIGLTVVGPEAALVKGIVDVFRKEGLKIFGPTARAAEIEGSKALAKEIMDKYNIPTAAYGTFTDLPLAEAYIRKVGAPLVVKADGLAAGKGVIIAMDEAAALLAVRDMMTHSAFGDAGKTVVIEELLEGEEVSVLAFTDGKTVVPMISAQDHKRIFDNDEGPNTGGMGAYAPAPVYTAEVAYEAITKVLQPVIDGMAKEGRFYSSVIYAGLMVTKQGVKVLEFNARFGDPETQPVLMMLETDLVDIIEAILAGKLAEQEIRWHQGTAVCVVVAAGGYPGDYEKGKVIAGLDDVQDAIVFHAGTALNNGKIVSSGGRVLGVSARGENTIAAVEKAYAAVDKIAFEGMQFRTDIAARALNRLG